MSTPEGNLADQLQVWGLEKDTVIFTDGSLGFALRLGTVDTSCRSNAAINELNGRIISFLNGLPAGIDLQFVQEIRSDNQDLIGKYEALSDPMAGELANKLCDARVEHLRDLDRKELLPHHALSLFVRRPLSRPLLERRSPFAREKLFTEISEERLQSEIRPLEKLRADIAEGLQAAGFSAEVIPASQIMDLMYRQWNPTRPIDRKDCHDPDDLRSSILFTDAAVYDNGLSLSGMHYRVLSLKMLPERTYASMASLLRHLPFLSRLQVSIQVPDQGKEIDYLKTQRRLTYSLAYGKTSGVRDVEGQAKFQDLEDLLEQLVAHGEKVFHAGIHVILRSPSEEELESQVSQTLALFRELAGAEAMEESLIAFDLFCELAIPNARLRTRTRRVKTSTLADLLPLYGPWEGHATPSILLQSQAMNLIPFDPFSSELTNANQIVSGGSGSGKSFMTNILLLQLLKENPRVYIVDVGGSYCSAGAPVESMS